MNKLYDEFKSQEDKMFINRLLRHRINTIVQETGQSYDVENPDYEVLKEAVEEIPDDDFH